MNSRNLNLDTNIKESFEIIIPENGKKEEILNNILSEMSNNESVKKQKFRFFADRFSGFAPYIAACACVLLIGFIGVKSGILDMLFTFDQKTESTAYMTADFNETYAESSAAYAIESYGQETACEEETEDGAESAEYISCVYTFYTYDENDLDFYAHAVTLSSFDPFVIWAEMQKLSDIYNDITLNSFSVDSDNMAVTLDFDSRISNLTKNEEGSLHISAIIKTFNSFYPEYNIKLTVNSEEVLNVTP